MHRKASRYERKRIAPVDIPRKCTPLFLRQWQDCGSVRSQVSSIERHSRYRGSTHVAAVDQRKIPRSVLGSRAERIVIRPLENDDESLFFGRPDRIDVSRMNEGRITGSQMLEMQNPLMIGPLDDNERMRDFLHYLIARSANGCQPLTSLMLGLKPKLIE